MRKVLLEYGRLQRDKVPTPLLRRLQRFDEQHAKLTGSCVFDWDHVRYIRALSFVGVVQVPGLTVEILPKVDTSAVATADGTAPDSETLSLAQRNLLYMLSIAKRVPLHERELASLETQRLPLLEALALIFVERLFDELRKGVDRAYMRREENLPLFKGKLLLRQHLSRNIAHQERCYVAYDEFLPDTWLNRILKAACRRLLSMVGSARVQQRLREALVFFGGVEDLAIEEYHFDSVHLNRNTRRFGVLLDFARLVLLGGTPCPRAGRLLTFSLLFPMETLFEEFIARFIRRYASEFGLERSQIHIQARRQGAWLLRTDAGEGRFRLRPDILVDGARGRPQLILDTKWKRLLRDVEDARNGVGQADLYQLYAYATRYKCLDNVLLFPRVEGVTPKSYRIDGGDGRLRVEFVDVSCDLRRNSAALKANLSTILSPRLVPSSVAPRS